VCVSLPFTGNPNSWKQGWWPFGYYVSFFWRGVQWLHLQIPKRISKAARMFDKNSKSHLQSCLHFWQGLSKFQNACSRSSKQIMSHFKVPQKLTGRELASIQHLTGASSNVKVQHSRRANPNFHLIFVLPTSKSQNLNRACPHFTAIIILHPT
jgi:hypothetical protein